MISGLIDAAISVWNDLLPGEDYDVTIKTEKNLTEGTFKTVTETVTSIVGFFEKLGTGFASWVWRRVKKP